MANYIALNKFKSQIEHEWILHMPCRIYSIIVRIHIVHVSAQRQTFGCTIVNGGWLTAKWNRQNQLFLPVCERWTDVCPVRRSSRIVVHTDIARSRRSICINSSFSHFDKQIQSCAVIHIAQASAVTVAVANFYFPNKTTQQWWWHWISSIVLRHSSSLCLRRWPARAVWQRTEVEVHLLFEYPPCGAHTFYEPVKFIHVAIKFYRLFQRHLLFASSSIPSRVDVIIQVDQNCVEVRLWLV